MGPTGALSKVISNAGPIGKLLAEGAFTKTTPFSNALEASTAVAQNNSGRAESVSKFRDSIAQTFPEIVGGGDSGSDTSPWAGMRTVGPHIGTASVPSPAERPATQPTEGAVSAPLAQATTAPVVAQKASYSPPQGNPGASTPGPLPETTPKGSLGSYTYNRLMKKWGLSPAAAAGITGNAAQESGFAEDVLAGRRRGDNGASGFMFQWQGPRLRGLLNYAREQGHSTPTIDDQIDYAVVEGQRGHDAGAAKALALLQNARSPEEASDIFRDYFERPSADDRESRRAHARKWAGQRGDPNWNPPQSLSGAGGPGAAGDTSDLIFGEVAFNEPQTPLEQVVAAYRGSGRRQGPETSTVEPPRAIPATRAEAALPAPAPNPMDQILQQIAQTKNTRQLRAMDRRSQLALFARAGQLKREKGTSNA